VTADWTDRPTLTGPRLVLTPLEPSDAADYLAALGTEAERTEVLAHLSIPVPDSAADAEAIIAAALADRDRIAYAQRLRHSAEFIGTTSFYEVSPSVRAVAVGHTWLGRRWWGSSLNAESKLVMLRRAFDELRAERVVWHTDIRNERSQRAIERLGATREGVLRHHRIRRDGSWRDTVQYSMLSAEWPTAKAELVGRLPIRFVRDEPESRYLAQVGTEIVGLVDFDELPDRVLITHTGTLPSWRGCGVAARLTAHVLADLAERGKTVRPLCWYTSKYLDEHPPAPEPITPSAPAAAEGRPRSTAAPDQPAPR
jgi:N-acetyltransferase